MVISLGLLLEQSQPASVIPAKAGIQYAAASRLIAGVSGILDHPLSRVMTTEGFADDDAAGGTNVLRY